MGEDGCVPAAAVDERRARVADLIGDRPLSARSVLATALLGADQPHLTVGELVEMASLFGISDGAARTCLWRMVSNGELTSDDGTYALAGRLARTAATRRRGIPDRRHRPSPWDGTWELAVVSLERRSATDRLALRKAATALHLAELREGVWFRPGQPRPEPLADAARRAGPAVCPLPWRRHRHSCRDREIAFQS